MPVTSKTFGCRRETGWSASGATGKGSTASASTTSGESVLRGRMATRIGSKSPITIRQVGRQYGEETTQYSPRRDPARGVPRASEGQPERPRACGRGTSATHQRDRAGQAGGDGRYRCSARQGIRHVGAVLDGFAGGLRPGGGA